MYPAIAFVFIALILGAMRILPMTDFYVGLTLFIFCGLVVIAVLQGIQRYLRRRYALASATPPLPGYLVSGVNAQPTSQSFTKSKWNSNLTRSSVMDTNPGSGLPSYDGITDIGGFPIGCGPDDDVKRLL